MLPSPAELIGFVVSAAHRGRHGVGASKPSNVLGTGDRRHCCRFSRSRCSSFPICRGSPTGCRRCGCSRVRDESLIWIVVIGQVLWILLPRLQRGLAFDRPSSAVRGRWSSVSRPSPERAVRAQRAAAFRPRWSMCSKRVRHLPSANWSLVPTGSLGVLFDQEYGIVPFAPVLLLAFVGLAGMLRDPSQRRLAIGLGRCVLLLIVLPGTFDPWWSKSAMPGQQLLLLLPLLVVPIAWLYGRLPSGSLARAGAQVLLLFSIAITLAMLLARVPVRQEADGSSALLHGCRRPGNSGAEAPSYVGESRGCGDGARCSWLAVFGIAGVAVFSSEDRRLPDAPLVAATTSVTLLFMALVICDVSRDVRQHKAVSTSKGACCFHLLETFDPIARPIAVRYDPLSLVGPASCRRCLRLSAVPGERTDSPARPCRLECALPACPPAGMSST